MESLRADNQDQARFMPAFHLSKPIQSFYLLRQSEVVFFHLELQESWLH